MTILKQSTQILVRIGPFVDVADGFTPEIGITLGAADEAELLKANGVATVDISGATWAAVTGADGWYNLTLTTAHTDTVGELLVVVQDDSVCLPVYQKFQVVEEAIYDKLFAASAALNDLSAAQVNTQADLALTDYDPPTKAELDAGLAALNDISTADVNAEVDTALSDYDAPTKAELDAGLAALNDLSAAEVNAEVDAALDTALPATPTVDSINEVLKRLARSVGVIQEYTVDGVTFSPTTTQFQVDAVDIGTLEETDEHFVGRVVIWTSGALVYQATGITAYDGTNKRFTVEAMTEAPTDGNTCIVI